MQQVQGRINVAPQQSAVMAHSTASWRAGLGAAALVIAGIFFVLYPWLRPFSDEVSLDGAAAFASDNWLIAHMLAMAGFTLLPVGVFSLYQSLRETVFERTAYWGLVLMQVAVGLTLPFYGGEAFGLHAIGQEALRQQSDALMGLSAVVRGGPGLILFLAALLLLGIASIFVAAVLWRAPTFSRWSGVPLALGLALFIPQFFASQPLRVAHGVLIAVGCTWIALEIWWHRAS
ncbi:MAG: hypothetical protein KDD84_06030 [Caldilineaceae bacterium]|nr:hypothetical protein [Caldilineaceae bacterium]